jgi:putative acyl-CoA dehydrogenase
MARLYREAPLNGIWEGAGNVVCLDVLRSIQKFPATVPALLDELRSARGADPRYDAFLADLEKDIADVLRSEGSARRFVERIALALSASLQIRYGPYDVADAFVASRLSGPWSGHFGTLPRGEDRGNSSTREAAARLSPPTSLKYEVVDNPACLGGLRGPALAAFFP